MSENPGNKRQRESRGESAGVDSRSHDKEYEVGYGKPPKQSRFVKGRSGNPHGRPRKKKPQPAKLSDAPSDGYVEAEAYRLIELLENGERIELPAMQAVVRAIIVNALKGNRLSQKYFLEYVERQEERHLQYKVQNYVRLEAVKRDGERAIADAERRGLEPPDLVPHPDDIVLYPSTGEAFVNGPEIPEDVAYYEHTMQLRDYGLLCSAHAEKTGKGLKIRYEGKTGCAYLLLAQLLDMTLPRRYRWGESDAIFLMMEYESLTRRERERCLDAEYERLKAMKPRLSHITPGMQEEIDRVVSKFLAKRRDVLVGHPETQDDD